MENAISLINTMPSNKEEIQSFFNQAKGMILSGHENPLKIKVQLKALEALLKKLNLDKDIEYYELEEANKHGKTFDLFNAKFQVKEVGVKYDFSNCNDYEYEKLIKEMNEIDIKIKEKEKELKGLKKEMAETDTGNIIYPPAKSSKTKVTVELK